MLNYATTPEYRQPQRLHGVGHHLLVADGYIDVIFLVVCFRDGVERRDRPALDNIKCIINQTPLDVLGAAEVFFDRSAQALKLQNLVIRQRLCVLPLGLDLLFLRAASFYGIQSQLLGGYLLIDNLAVPHLIAISIHQPGDQGLTKPKAGIDG